MSEFPSLPRPITFLPGVMAGELARSDEWSGTTGVACVEEDVAFTGIERESRYMAIAEARIRHAEAKPRQLGLFG